MTNHCFHSFFYSTCWIKVFRRFINILILLVLNFVQPSFLTNVSKGFKFWVWSISYIWIKSHWNLINRLLSQSLINSGFYDFLFSVMLEPFWSFSILIISALIFSRLWNDCVWMIIVPFFNHFVGLFEILIFSKFI